MGAPRNVYTINYFPINNSGFSMWSSYDGVQYQADMDMAKNLGFNTIRVILAATNGVFDWPSPTGGELANLTDFYNRAKTVGIKLHLNLFDWWGLYGKITGSQTWATAILGALPDTTALACIELENETPYASTSSYTGGFDAGWTTSQPSTVGPTALGWAQLMIPYLRSAAPGVPIVTSNTNGTPDISALFSTVNGTSAAPDWYEWHCYVNPGAPYQAMQAIINVIGDPENLYIGEVGATTTPTGTQGTLQAQQAQSDYIQTVRWACSQLNLPEPSPWILFDLNSSTQFSGGQTFGLFDTSGNAKISATMYQALPPGSTVPAIGINGSMQGNQPDTNGNALPNRWILYKGNSGTQPIDSAIDTNTIYDNNPTLQLTGSGSTSGSDNPPALQSSPSTWPLISPGQSYTFSCALKATGSYGSPSLQISWYSSAGTYLASANGTTLTLTSSFVIYSVNGTAPVSAAYALLFVRVGYNAGSIWVGGATWVGANGRLISHGNQWYRQT